MAPKNGHKNGATKRMKKSTSGRNFLEVGWFSSECCAQRQTGFEDKLG